MMAWLFLLGSTLLPVAAIGPVHVQNVLLRATYLTAIWCSALVSQLLTWAIESKRIVLSRWLLAAALTAITVGSISSLCHVEYYRADWITAQQLGRVVAADLATAENAGIQKCVLYHTPLFWLRDVHSCQPLTLDLYLRRVMRPRDVAFVVVPNDSPDTPLFRFMTGVAQTLSVPGGCEATRYYYFESLDSTRYLSDWRLLPTATMPAAQKGD
jgi:hypothetical protein